MLTSIVRELKSPGLRRGLTTGNLISNHLVDI